MTYENYGAGAPGENERQRLDEELRHAIGRLLIKHANVLRDDARQKQANSIAEAQAKGLKFVDIYIQETETSVPAGRAEAVLLTPEGKPLRPSIPSPRIYVYYPLELGQTEQDPNLRWYEWQGAGGAKVLYTVSDQGVQETVTEIDDPEAFTDPAWLPHADGRNFLNEVRSFRLAPLEHHPLLADE